VTTCHEGNPLLRLVPPFGGCDGAIFCAVSGALYMFNRHVTRCWGECKTHLAEYCAGCGNIKETGWAPLSVMRRRCFLPIWPFLVRQAALALSDLQAAIHPGRRSKGREKRSGLLAVSKTDVSVQERDKQHAVQVLGLSALQNLCQSSDMKRQRLICARQALEPFGMQRPTKNL
jgi:hypothetical protein